MTRARMRCALHGIDKGADAGAGAASPRPFSCSFFLCSTGENSCSFSSAYPFIFKEISKNILFFKKGCSFYENHVSIKMVDVSKNCLEIGRAYRRGRNKTWRRRRERNEYFGTGPGVTTKGPQ